MNIFGMEIDKKSICIFRPGVSKHEALDCLVDAVSDSGKVLDREAFRQALYEREAVQSTGIGGGVAIPHVRIDEVREPTLGIGISREGIDFGSLDSELVHVIVVFAMSHRSQKEYLGLLAQAMVALRNPELRERLSACGTADEAGAVLNGCAV